MSVYITQNTVFAMYNVVSQHEKDLKLQIQMSRRIQGGRHAIMQKVVLQGNNHTPPHPSQKGGCKHYSPNEAMYKVSETFRDQPTTYAFPTRVAPQTRLE